MAALVRDPCLVQITPQQQLIKN